MPDNTRHPHRWGYADSQLELADPRTVRMNGHRYVLSGQSLPHLIPFVEQMLGVPFDPASRIAVVPAQVPASRATAALMSALERILPGDRRSTDAETRLIHSHGSTSVREIDRALYGGGLPRVVDVVVEPESEAEVQAIVHAAVAHDACLVPYGGGTNVSGALLCPEDEPRAIVSLDMLNRSWY